jgi:Uma2 family endonuclease
MSVAYKSQNEYKETTGYAYKDYALWDDGVRCELIDGVPYVMSAPLIKHQLISGEIYGQLRDFLKGKQCKVMHAAVDVRLNAHQKDNTIVQPDIIVVCDRKKIENGKSCIGAPDMVVEVLSPSNRYWDYLIKEKIYLEAGVREYWIVDPEEETVQQLILENRGYEVVQYKAADTVPVHILPGCEINLADVFSEAAIEPPIEST